MLWELLIPKHKQLMSQYGRRLRRICAPISFDSNLSSQRPCPHKTKPLRWSWLLYIHEVRSKITNRRAGEAPFMPIHWTHGAIALFVKSRNSRSKSTQVFQRLQPVRDFLVVQGSWSRSQLHCKNVESQLLLKSWTAELHWVILWDMEHEKSISPKHTQTRTDAHTHTEWHEIMFWNYKVVISSSAYNPQSKLQFLFLILKCRWYLWPNTWKSWSISPSAQFKQTKYCINDSSLLAFIIQWKVV